MVDNHFGSYSARYESFQTQEQEESKQFQAFQFSLCNNVDSQSSGNIDAFCQVFDERKFNLNTVGSVGDL